MNQRTQGDHKVIDADNQKIIEWFKEADAKEVIKRYKKTGKWQDVGLDKDGDIILWKEY